MALPKPTSPEDICNISNALLNQGPVVNISTPTLPSEFLCKIHYAQERRATLRAHTWNFAIKRAVLASDATAPLFGFSEAFSVPADFLRYMSRHDELGGSLLSQPVEGVDYQFEGGKLLLNTSDATLRMRYIFDNEDISTWDPLFIRLFTHNMALRMAPSYKGAPRTISNIKDSLREIKGEAKAIDGQERPPIRKQTSRALQSRRNRSSSVAGRFTKFE